MKNSDNTNVNNWTKTLFSSNKDNTTMFADMDRTDESIFIPLTVFLQAFSLQYDYSSVRKLSQDSNTYEFLMTQPTKIIQQTFQEV